MISTLQKTAIASVFIGVASAAQADDLPPKNPITLEDVAAHLNLPLGMNHYYFNRGVNVAIRERCEASKNTITCRMEAVHLEALLISARAYDIQTDGRHIQVTERAIGRDDPFKHSLREAPGYPRSSGYDTKRWKQWRERSETVDGEKTPVGQALIESGNQTAQVFSEIQERHVYAQNNDLAAHVEAGFVKISSIMPVNGHRAYECSTNFDKVSFSVSAQCDFHFTNFNGSFVSVKGQPVRRENWSRGDDRTFASYSDFGNGEFLLGRD